MRHLFDTHCHLGYPPLCDSLEEIAQKMKDSNVLEAMIVGCDPKTNASAYAASKIETHWYSSVGAHPTEVQNLNDAEWMLWQKEILKQIELFRPYAIGEIGIDDFHTDPIHRDQQLERQKICFEWMSGQAKINQLPIIIHTRNAPKLTLECLQVFQPQASILHCFTENMEFAQQFLELPGKHKISFSGILTYKKSEEIRDVARCIPLKNILIETDSPWLAPDPKREKINDPSQVSKVFECLCSIRQESPEEIAETLYQSSHEIFGIPLL